MSRKSTTNKSQPPSDSAGAQRLRGYLAQQVYEDDTPGVEGRSGLKQKFILLFVLAIVWALAMAGLAYYALNQQQQVKTQLTEKHLEPGAQLFALRAHLADMFAELAQADARSQVNGKSDYLKQRYKNFESRAQQVNASWKALVDSSSQNEDKARYDALDLKIRRLEASSRVAFDTLRTRTKDRKDSFEEFYNPPPGLPLVKLSESELKKPFDYAAGLYDEVNNELSDITRQKMESGKSLARNSSASTYIIWLMGLTALGLVVLGIVIFGLWQRLSTSIHSLSRVLRQLSQGDLGRKRLALPDDEFASLTSSLNNLNTSMLRVATFAAEIGEGQFDSELPPLGDNDELGVALNTMRDRLLAVAKDDQIRNWNIAGMAQFGEILRLADDPETLAERTITSLAKYIKAHHAAFFDLQESEADGETELVLLAGYGTQKKKAGARNFQLGEGFVGQAAVEKEIISITDVPTDYVTMTSGLGEATPRCLLIVPLLHNGIVYGVVEFASFTNFENHEIDFVKRLSENIAASLGSLKSRRKTLRLLNESQKLSAELQANQSELLRHTSELEEKQTALLLTQQELSGQLSALNNAAIVSETDLQGNITFVNERFLALSRYTRPELLGQNHRMLKSTFHDENYFRDLWNTISTGRVWKGEFKNLNKDKAVYWVDATITPVLGAEGRPIKFISVTFDITNQKAQDEQIRTALEEAMAQEEELRQNAEELEATTEEMRRTQVELAGQINALNNSAIVSEADLQGRIIAINDQFIRISRYTREELIGQNHRVLKSGHQADDVFESLWQTIASGKVWKGEIKNRSKEGSFYWVTSTITPVLDALNRPIKYISVTFDITPQKLQEEQIRAALEISQAQEQELRQNADELQAAQDEMRKTQIELRGQIGALNNAGIVAETDLRGNIILVNEEFTRVSGYAREQLLGQNHRILKSGDYDENYYVQLWETICNGRVWTGILKNRNLNGEFYWVKTTITPVLGFDGKPLKYIGVSFDISSQVEQEEQIRAALEVSQQQEFALRENAEVMQRQQLELNGQINAVNNAALVAETDPEGRILMVNDEAASIWGYERSELLGQPISILKSDAHDAEFFQTLWQTISSGQVWKGEIQNKTKKGKDVWAQLTITPVLDTQAAVTKYIAVSFDITRVKLQGVRIKKLFEEAKEQEKEMRRYAEELENVQREMLETQLELAGRMTAINNGSIVSETDADGNITFVNDEATFIWGYERSELLGQNHRILKAPGANEKVYARMWEKLSLGHHWKGEVMNRAKDGSIFWEELVVTPILDSEGKVHKYIGVAYDITRQKNQSLRIKDALKLAEATEAQQSRRIAELETTLAQLQAEAEAQAKTQPQDNATITVDTAVLAELEASRQQLTELQNLAAAQVKELAQLRLQAEELAGLKTEKSILMRALAESQAAEEQLRQQLATHSTGDQQHTAQLEQQLAAALAQRTQLEQALASLQTERNWLQQMLQQAPSTEQLAKLQAEIQALQHSLNEAPSAEEVEALQAALLEAHQQLNELNKKIAETGNGQAQSTETEPEQGQWAALLDAKGNILHASAGLAAALKRTPAQLQNRLISSWFKGVELRKLLSGETLQRLMLQADPSHPGWLALGWPNSSRADTYWVIALSAELPTVANLLNLEQEVALQRTQLQNVQATTESELTALIDEYQRMFAEKEQELQALHARLAQAKLPLN